MVFTQKVRNSKNDLPNFKYLTSINFEISNILINFPKLKLFAVFELLLDFQEFSKNRLEFEQELEAILQILKPRNTFYACLKYLIKFSFELVGLSKAQSPYSVFTWQNKNLSNLYSKIFHIPIDLN